MKTTEEINQEWEEFRKAKDKFPGLRRFIRLWNERARLSVRLQKVEKRLQEALDEVPEECVKHLPHGRRKI